MRRLLLAFMLLGWNVIVIASPDAEPFVTDRTAIEQQQKTLLEQAEQQRNDSRTPDAPRHQFRKYSLNTSYLYSLTPTLYYLTSAYGQTSSDNLYASERIAIGGQYSVRGFKEQYLSGLRGVYWRNELNWQPAFKLFPVEFTFTAALDSGWIQTREPLVEGGYVTGAALSVTLNGRRMQHATTFGKPLSSPHTLHPDPWVIYWQTTVTL